jgi:hypothetical protein
VIYSKQEFDKLCHDKTTLCYKIKKKGKQIYAKIGKA